MRYFARGIGHSSNDFGASWHPRSELGHGDARADRDEQLSLEGVGHSFFEEDRLGHLRFRASLD